MAQADAVPFEFGPKRAEGMEKRALIKSWEPQLRTIYLQEVALMQHRVFGAEEHLPLAVHNAQRRFSEACASLLLQMADYLDGKIPGSWTDLDAPLAELSRSVQENSMDGARFVAASGLEKLSRTIFDLMTELSQEIGRSRLVRTVA